MIIIILLFNCDFFSPLCISNFSRPSKSLFSTFWAQLEQHLFGTDYLELVKAEVILEFRFYKRP